MARGRRGRSRLNISPPPRSTPDGGPPASRSTKRHETPEPEHGLDAVSPAPYVQSHVSVKTTSSYTAIVNPDESDSLSYVQAPILNGVQCPTLEPKGVAPEIAHWQSSVLCTVLGANPPLDVIERYVHKIWAAYAIDKVCLVRAGLFLVRFKNLEEQLDVVNKRVYYFARKPFIVKPWNAEMEINTEEICSLPIWVQLPAKAHTDAPRPATPTDCNRFIPLQDAAPDQIAPIVGSLSRQSPYG
ncbi:hypothetical protein Cgig2_021433 [Carnegiea gigantea]|uniref:DUF4283 domain-containing protein n=1 Tax=Carnegiea gigantea TaxID=171969 RepID=A0A9Q1GHY4_9CARY|nr:hypothetical protein Cgig2_021433 [Carnegiea gigantea]